jgi:ATP-binding cassette subfamily C protein
MTGGLFSGSLLAEVRRLLRQLTRREAWTFWGLVAARALSSVLDMVGILLVGLLTLVVASRLPGTSGQPSRIAGIELPAFDQAGIVWLAVVVLGIFVVKAVVALALSRLLTLQVAKIEWRNAERITRHVFAGPLDRLKGITQAELQYDVTESITYGFTGALNNLSIVVSESFLLLVLTLTLLVVDPVAAVFTLVYFALVVVLVQVFVGRTLKRAGRAVTGGTLETMDALGSTMNAFREITVLRKNEVFVRRIMDRRRTVSRNDATMALLGITPRYVIETALILGVVLLIGQQFLSGQLVSGLATVAVFLAGGVRLMASLMPLQNSLGHVKQHLERARPALDILDSIPQKPATESADTASAPPSGAEPLDVVFDGVSYRYPDAPADALAGVELRIDPGAYVAVIGPSGAGKTTFVDVLLGLVVPSKGSVTIDGVAPLALRMREPGSVAYVPQKPGIVSGTIAENVALGLSADELDRDRVAEALEAAFLTDFVSSLPGGMDSMLGTEGANLSGGQVQRIGLARALYTSPRLLVLDEATSGLDASSEAFVARTIAALHGTVTVVVIAHRLSSVQHADVVHFVEGGRVTASGDFKTIRDTVPAVAEYVRLMSFES